MVADLGYLVRLETPSSSKALLDDAIEKVKSLMSDRILAEYDLIAHSDFGNNLRVRAPGTQAKALLLTHYDTVWPEGTTTLRPFRVGDGIAYGPGVFDMKAGLVQGLWAIRALQALGRSMPSTVLLCTSDEELASYSARALLDAEAPSADIICVLEPSVDGRLKTARKGQGRFRIAVEGHAAHAGLDPLSGVSAIEKLVELILAVKDMASGTLGTTMNIGLIAGGVAANVVAPDASAEIDVRVSTQKEASRVSEALHSLTSSNKGTKVAVTGGFERPPWPLSESTLQAFAAANRAASRLSLQLEAAPMVGGSSDANLVARHGRPVIDGLGAVGGGAHAEGEYVVVSTMPERAAVLAELLVDVA
jgi:glutamate carboxypeptidase